jgi:hypothetical protein
MSSCGNDECDPVILSEAPVILSEVPVILSEAKDLELRILSCFAVSAAQHDDGSNTHH